MEYRVTYVIEVEADDPVAAAREAYACMVDPESQAPILEVQEMEHLPDNGGVTLGATVDVDLEKVFDMDDLVANDAEDLN